MPKRTSRTRNQKQAPGDPGLHVSMIPMKLDRIGLRTLSYNEVTPSEPVRPLPLGERVNIKTEMEFKFSVFAEGLEVYTEVLAKPDSKHMPFEIRAGISAFFSRPADITDEKVLEFATGAAVRIIFPYVREVISSTSMRGMFGPVWIDPMAITIIGPQLRPPVPSPPSV